MAQQVRLKDFFQQYGLWDKLQYDPKSKKFTLFGKDFLTPSEYAAAGWKVDQEGRGWVNTDWLYNKLATFLTEKGYVPTRQWANTTQHWTVKWDPNTKQVIISNGEKEATIGEGNYVNLGGVTYISPEMQSFLIDYFNNTSSSDNADVMQTRLAPRGQATLEPYSSEETSQTQTQPSTDQQETGTQEQTEQQSDFDRLFNAQYQSKLNEYDIRIQTYQDIYNQLSDIDNNPYLKELANTYKHLLDAELANLEVMYNNQLTALQSQKETVDANYKNMLMDIDQAIEAARKRQAEDMAARGVYFSGLLTNALNQIEAQGIIEKAKAANLRTAELNKIAAQIATLTANYELQKNEVKNRLIAEEGLKRLAFLEKNEDKKQQYLELIKGLEAEKKILETNKPYSYDIAKYEYEQQQNQAANEEMWREREYQLKLDQANREWAQLKDQSNRAWQQIYMDYENSLRQYNLNLAQLEETSRHNRAVEAETARHNRMMEQIDLARLNASLRAASGDKNTPTVNDLSFLYDPQKWANTINSITNAINNITEKYKVSGTGRIDLTSMTDTDRQAYEVLTRTRDALVGLPNIHKYAASGDAKTIHDIFVSLVQTFPLDQMTIQKIESQYLNSTYADVLIPAFRLIYKSGGVQSVIDQNFMDDVKTTMHAWSQAGYSNSEVFNMAKFLQQILSPDASFMTTGRIGGK